MFLKDAYLKFLNIYSLFLHFLIVNLIKMFTLQLNVKLTKKTIAFIFLKKYT